MAWASEAASCGIIQGERAGGAIGQRERSLTKWQSYKVLVHRRVLQGRSLLGHIGAGEEQGRRADHGAEPGPHGYLRVGETFAHCQAKVGSQCQPTLNQGSTTQQLPRGKSMPSAAGMFQRPRETVRVKGLGGSFISFIALDDPLPPPSSWQDAMSPEGSTSWCDPPCFQAGTRWNREGIAPGSRTNAFLAFCIRVLGTTPRALHATPPDPAPLTYSTKCRASYALAGTPCCG